MGTTRQRHDGVHGSVRREEWPYGFHSIPIHEDKSPFQTKEQLGTLRSGGCVRQDFDDAEWTFGWTDVGTRVIMLP